MANRNDETFTCPGKGREPHVLACKGRILPISELAEQGKAKHCKECARVRAYFDGPLRTAIGERYGWDMQSCSRQIGCNEHFDEAGNQKSWSYWNSHKKPDWVPGETIREQCKHLTDEEWNLVFEGTSTALRNEEFAKNLAYATWEDARVKVDGLDPPMNASVADPIVAPSELDAGTAAWLDRHNPPAPETDEPSEQAATRGILYLGDNPSFEGWVKSGKTSSSSRWGAYNTGDPYRAYQLLAVAHIEDGLSDAEHKFQDALDAKAEQSGVNPSGGRRSEWFKISKEDAIEILRNMEDITEFHEYPGDE